MRRGDRLRAGDHDIELPSKALWRHGVRLVGVSSADELPAPDASYFRYSRVWRPHQTLVRRKLTTHKRKLAPSTTALDHIAAETASHKNASPKNLSPPTAPPSPKNHTSPRPPRPVGHQLQLSKPTAMLSQ